MRPRDRNHGINDNKMWKNRWMYIALVASSLCLLACSTGGGGTHLGTLVNGVYYYSVGLKIYSYTLEKLNS